MAADIDNLSVSKSVIDLEAHSEGNFGLDEFVFQSVLDDVILVEYVDAMGAEGGDAIKRGSIYIPTNTLKSAWRKAKVILAGPTVKYVKEGDIVVFPGNLGVTVANLAVEDHGTLTKGVFLNENRIFGICRPK